MENAVLNVRLGSTLPERLECIQHCLERAAELTQRAWGEGNEPTSGAWLDVLEVMRLQQEAIMLLIEPKVEP